MTKIKLCGLSRPEDIAAANKLTPEYVGFVFAKGSKRYVTAQTAKILKSQLNGSILAVGVFVNSPVEEVANLLNDGVIDLAQFHGSENEEYISALKGLTDKPVIKAFSLETEADAARANNSSADLILLDSAVGGSGKTFDRSLLKFIKRQYFLAGGLDAENVVEAVRSFHPFAVDVSSGIETDGVKDKTKMAEFVRAVKGADAEDRL